MTGIVKILLHVADTFVQRCNVAFVAHHFAFTLLNFEFARFAVWRGALKIRVSMVRFRPRPPNSKTPTRESWWGFFFYRSRLGCCSRVRWASGLAGGNCCCSFWVLVSTIDLRQARSFFATHMPAIARTGMLNMSPRTIKVP